MTSGCVHYPHSMSWEVLQPDPGLLRGSGPRLPGVAFFSPRISTLALGLMEAVALGVKVHWVGSSGCQAGQSRPE